MRYQLTVIFARRSPRPRVGIYDRVTPIRSTFMQRLALVVLFAGVTTAQIPGIDWVKQKAEVIQHHRALIQIDTSNPTGNETKAVASLKKVLEAQGIPTLTFALDT